MQTDDKPTLHFRSTLYTLAPIPVRRPPLHPPKRVLTTGEMARICRVTKRTVINWLDSGRLPGYRVPGSRHRRIPYENVLSFMREHGIMARPDP